MTSLEKRGGKAIAELSGYGATADAHHITQPGPEGEGGARAMNMALKKAQISADEIDYVNAHGTSTKLNDKNETLAIKKVFKDHAYNVAISSTKSMTGHLLGAAGGIEAVATLLTIKNNFVYLDL